MRRYQFQSRAIVSAATTAAGAILSTSSADIAMVGFGVATAFAPQHLQRPSALRVAPTYVWNSSGEFVRTRGDGGVFDGRIERNANRRSFGPLRVSSVEEVTEEMSSSSGKMAMDVVGMEEGTNLSSSPLREELKNNVKQAHESSKSLGAIIREKTGTVDENRLVFPEIASGEVPRLYSNLDYSKSAEGKVTAVRHVAGSTVGAAALVAGTTIGAGTLALPAATAPAGFLPSSAALILAWVYMVISGLLVSELTINRIGETGRPGVGLIEVYKNSLGKKWAAVGTAAYLFLHYAIMVAYVAQGGVNLDAFLEAAGVDNILMIPGFGQVAFAAAVGAPLFFIKSSTMEKVNNALVVGVGATFLGIIGLGFGSADFGALVSLENQHPEVVVDAFPILFLSLVYQNVVPTVVTQLEGDKAKITKAIIGGTAVPLLMFLAWNAVVLGNVAAAPGALTGALDPVALLQSGEHGGPALSALVGIFSELALITSLIGFVYGTVDALTDVFGLPATGPRYDRWKPALFAATLLPPIALALSDPDVFYKALDYGGAFGVSTLFLVLTPIMVWKQRYGGEKGPLTVRPMVPFGKIPLGSLWKAAATLIVEQGADKLGIIDFIRHNVLH